VAALEPTYIYLLWHETAGVFKIGKANDVWARMRSLPDPIDMSRSRHILVPNALLANRVEKLCHVLFKEHVRPRPHRGDGYTEWFDGAVYGDVEAFLEANRTFMGCGPLCPIPVKVRGQPVETGEPPKTNSWQEARQIQRLESAARHAALRQQFNAQALSSALVWLRAIEETATIIGWFDHTFVVWVDAEWSQFQSLGQLHHFLVDKRVLSIFEGCSSSANGLVMFECGGSRDWMRGRSARWGVSELEPLERMLVAAPDVPTACLDELRSLHSVSFFDELRASDAERREWSLYKRKVTSRILAEVLEERKSVPYVEQQGIAFANY